jgi:outer membrane protein insertion porin family
MILRWIVCTLAFTSLLLLAETSDAAKKKSTSTTTPAAADTATEADAEAATTDSASGEVSNNAGGIIKKIEVKGNRKIEKDAIIEKLLSKEGESLSRDKVHDDIVALHKLGYFDSVSVDYEGGTLTYTLKERPTIQRIIFFGNDQITTDDLKALLTVKAYDLYDENIVRESVRKLTQHYEEKGYYLAKVTYETRYNKERDGVELLFKVREYDKVRIRKISFIGNTAFSDDQLKRTLRNTQEGGFFSWMSGSGNFKELEFKSDLQQGLLFWYLNEGYVRFKYDTPIVTVSEDKKWVYITIKVTEGKRYKLSTVDFGGDLLFPKEELHDSLILKEGAYFALGKRNQDVVALTEKYQDLGYANVNVIPQMDINDENLTIATTYEFEKGTLVRYGRINIKGDTKTRDKVIRRELKIREGELYSGTGMRESKENVERLGFFEQGKVEFQTSSPPGRPDIMDVTILVKEHPTGQFQLGAGYSTQSKFFFTTSVAETNFLGRGQDLRFSAQVAADRKNRSFSISFTEPYVYDSLWSAGGDLYSTVSTVPEKYIEFRKGLGARFGHPLGEYTRLYFGYRLEQFRLSDVADPIVKLNQSREEGTLSSVTASIQYDRRNNRMDPTGGYFLSWGHEVAGLGGNRRFVRTTGDARYYKRIWDEFVFRTKVEAGNVTNTDGNGIQSAERFYLGGPSNLKGYRFPTVGPRQNILGATLYTGAQNQAFYIAEIEYPIVKDIGLKAVVFYDIGDAFNKISEVDLRQDYGWGLRWFSPLGPLRFEWGYPINPRRDANGNQIDESSIFQFNIGPSF